MATFTATFNGDGGKPLGTATLPETERGWWAGGSRSDVFQSEERPFTVFLAANDRADFKGRMMFVDTGEAFSYFDAKVLRMPAAPDLSALFASPFGMPMPPMPEMPQPPQMRMPVPRTGRPERQFLGIAGYCDRLARELIGNDDEGKPKRLWFMGEELVGETEAEAVAREEADGRRLMAALAPINGRTFNYVLNRSLNRTILRTYKFEASPSGPEWMLWYGTHLVGHDTYQFPASSGIASLPGGPHPFGEGERGNADLYDVEWMATRRFGGLCPADDDTEQFKGWLLQMFETARLDPAVRQEMEGMRKAMAEAGREEHRRDLEGLRQLNAEMREESRRKDEIRAWEDARRRQRKEESDRRIREGWSAINRGVEQYRGPNGELIEIPIGGPGSRAYYDRYTGTILHTDGYPIGWEELPRWRW